MSGFLRRWSERKAGAGRKPPELAPPDLTPPDLIPPEVDGPAEGTEPAGEALAQHPVNAAADEAVIAARLAALPPVDQIGPDTDIRPFLESFVPAALRKAALRRAWAVNPVISTHLDAARDYAWDFNGPTLPAGFAGGLDGGTLRRGLDVLRGRPEPAPPAPAEADAEAHPDPAPDPSDADPLPDQPAPAEQPATAPADPDERRQALLRAARPHGAALPDA